MKQNELEMIIDYQTKSLDYMKKLLFDQIEKDKKAELKSKVASGLATDEEDEELETANKELELDHGRQMKEEEGLEHEADWIPTDIAGEYEERRK